eukprot:1182559-Prorocentrum_minimum.AAC.4
MREHGRSAATNDCRCADFVQLVGNAHRNRPLRAAAVRKAAPKRSALGPAALIDSFTRALTNDRNRPTEIQVKKSNRNCPVAGSTWYVSVTRLGALARDRVYSPCPLQGAGCHACAARSHPGRGVPPPPPPPPLFSFSLPAPSGTPSRAAPARAPTLFDMIIRLIPFSPRSPNVPGDTYRLLTNLPRQAYGASATQYHSTTVFV